MLKNTMHEASLIKLVKRAILPLIICWLLISLSFLVPLLDSTRPPYINLDSVFSEIVYWLAVSGGKFGAPVIGLFMLAVLVMREGINSRRKYREAGFILLVTSILAGGGAALNEHVIKAELKVPRPNILWLATGNGTAENVQGPLGMSAEQFYQLGDKQARRQPLQDVLNQQPELIALSAIVKAHWIEETGYSFPSGHAFSAMFFATFFLLTAVTFLSGRRRGVFYLLLPWALAVCYSRTLLRLHTPTDIAVGGLQGLLLGLLAWMIVRAMFRRFN